MSELLKCPQCIEEGTRSKVYTNGSTSTLLGWRGPYYDEDGEHHSHDPNQVTSHYSCDNGHQFAASRRRACPNRKCDYGKSPEEIAAQQKPQCCGGGPQWGHQFDCPNCPD